MPGYGLLQAQTTGYRLSGFRLVRGFRALSLNPEPEVLLILKEGKWHGSLSYY